MVLLGIETAGRRGNVALWDADRSRVIGSYRFPEGPSHARDIVPAIDETLTEAGLRKEEIDAVAVSRGPGSFTGLRVGITCAKTMAYILQWQTVGVPSLEVLVQNVEPREYDARTACPLRDARRGAVYGTLYRWEDQMWKDQTGVVLASPEEVRRQLPEGTVVFGSGLRAHREAFIESPDGSLIEGPESLEEARAEEVARVGARMIRAGKSVTPFELEPRYYRRTAAEDNLGKTVG